MRFKTLLYFFCAALILIQSCRKSNDTLKTQSTTDNTMISSGLRLNKVGDYGIYQFINSKGNFAQVAANSVKAGATLNVAAGSGSAFQKWKITRVSDLYYTIMNLGSGMYAQAYNYNGTRVLVQNKATGTDEQLWSLAVTAGKIYKAINKATGLAATDNGTGMALLKPYTGLATQDWAYNQLPLSDTGDSGDVLPSGIYTISSAAATAGKVIGVQNASMNTGVFVVQSNYLLAQNEQKWNVVKYNSGFYKIYSIYSNNALDITQSATGSKIVMKKPAQTDTQLWKIVKAAPGVFGIVNKASGYCLNLLSPSPTGNIFVAQDVTTYTATHGWTFKPVNAMQIDTVITRSAAMKKDIKAVVILPSNYNTDGKKYPVMYLLHGHGASYLDFPANAPQLRNYADKYGMIIVSADGNIASWYFNAIRDAANWQYETYITSELVSWVDTHYRTIRSNKGRGIVGYSMGGHGALYSAFKHQDVYGACGSISGCVDITRVDTIGWKFPYNINERLGPHSGATAVNWTNNSVLYMTDLVKNTQLTISFDCDETDGFYYMNNDLDRKLTAQGTPHTYQHDHANIFYGHTWAYWSYKLPWHFDQVSAKLSQAQ